MSCRSSFSRALPERRRTAGARGTRPGGTSNARTPRLPSSDIERKAADMARL